MEKEKTEQQSINDTEKVTVDQEEIKEASKQKEENLEEKNPETKIVKLEKKIVKIL